MHGRVVLRNSAALFAAEVVNRFLTVAFFAFLARYLNPSDTGVYITLVTYLAVGMLAIDPGLSQTLIRSISQDPNQASSDLVPSLILTTCLWCTTVVALFSVASVFAYPSILKRLLVFGCVSLGFQSWAQMASAYLKAKQRMVIVAVGTSLGLFFFSAAAALWLVRGGGIVGLACLLMMQAMFQCIYLWIAAFRVGVSFAGGPWHPTHAVRFLREVIPVGLLAGAGIALNSIGIFMVSRMGDMVGTAHYGLASKLIDSLSLLSNSVLTAVFPFFSAKWVESEAEVKRGLLYAAKFFLVVGMISAIGVTVDARELIAMLFGVQFTGMRATLVVLIWSFFCYMAGAPLGVIILVDKDRLARFLPYIPAVLAANILLNLWLIPRYSYFGASVSTLVCSVVIYVIKVLLVRALLPSWKDLLRISWRPVVAAFSMTVVLLITRQGPLLVSAVCGGVAFVGGLYCLGEFAGAEYAGFHGEPTLRVGGGAWTNGRSGPVEE